MPIFSCTQWPLQTSRPPDLLTFICLLNCSIAQKIKKMPNSAYTQHAPESSSSHSLYSAF